MLAMLTSGGMPSDFGLESTEILSMWSGKYDGLNCSGGASAITGCGRLGAKVLWIVTRVSFQNIFLEVESRPDRSGPESKIRSANRRKGYRERRQCFFRSSLITGLRDGNCGALESNV